jgi:hypothetical protein
MKKGPRGATLACMTETQEEAQPGKRRPWFQFRLSTAIVLMFVLGGLLWANTCQRVVWEGVVHWDADPPLGGAARYRTWGCGFPFPAYTPRTEVTWGTPPPSWAPPEWHAAALVCNLAVGLVVLSIAGVACEWLSRRRERRSRLNRPSDKP